MYANPRATPQQSLCGDVEGSIGLPEVGDCVGVVLGREKTTRSTGSTGAGVGKAGVAEFERHVLSYVMVHSCSSCWESGKKYGRWRREHGNGVRIPFQADAA